METEHFQAPFGVIIFRSTQIDQMFWSLGLFC